VKAEPNSLKAFLGVVKSLGMSVKLMQLSIVGSRWMTKRPICV
jgi:hypothetical protein